MRKIMDKPETQILCRNNKNMHGAEARAIQGFFCRRQKPKAGEDPADVIKYQIYTDN